MSTSSDSDRVAAVATAARSALSRRFQNAVLAHTETLVDLGEPEPDNPVAKPRDFERYHMAWLARQALTGIATPELLRDARRDKPVMRGPAAVPCQPPAHVKSTAPTRSELPALRPRLMELSLSAFGLLMLSLVVTTFSADRDVSLAMGAVAVLTSAGVVVAGRRLCRRQTWSDRVDVRYTAVKHLRPTRAVHRINAEAADSNRRSRGCYDAIQSMWLSGRLSGFRRSRGGVAAAVWSTTGNRPTSVMATVASPVHGTRVAGGAGIVVPVTIASAGAFRSTTGHRSVVMVTTITETLGIDSSVNAAGSIGVQGGLCLAR